MIARAGLAALLMAIAAGVAPGAAWAEFGFVPGATTLEIVDAEGQPDNRAGAHPDLVRIGFALETEEADGSLARPKGLVFDLPPGLAGDPAAVPACSRTVFDSGGEPECPEESRVGTIVATIPGRDSPEVFPVYSIEPASGQLAQLGFKFVSKFPLSMRLRSADYGLSIDQGGLLQSLSMEKGTVDLWGVPADHQQGTEIPRRAFLTTPTRCDGGPLTVVLHARSWDHPERWVGDRADTGAPLQGCDELPFSPGLSLGLKSPVADSPSGARIAFAVPQSDDPGGRATSHVRRIVLDLPAGLAVSPGGAAGRRACSDAAFAAGSEAEAECPVASRVGTVELRSPALRAPLDGDMYLGEERPGERFRVFVVAAGPGVEAKLSGVLRPDPATGQLELELAELPELPLASLVAEFDDGPRALLATPLGCGPLEATASFTPYAGGPPVGAADRDAIDAQPGGRACAGPAPFAPGFVAGTSNPMAGRPTGFSATLRREDGERLPDRFSVTLPPGLSAAVGRIGRCPEPLVALAACPASSRIGSVLAEVGPGSEPAQLGGDAYLTGPYRKAPFGVAMAFRAALGPFDLGALVVRAALRLDLDHGLVTIETDSLPRIVEGVPVRFRTVGLDLDRPDFLRNPTACDPSRVDAVVWPQDGPGNAVATPFGLRGCDALRFDPRFELLLSGRRELRPRGRPALRISTAIPPGSTNLRSVQLTLPRLLEFRPAGLGELCARQAAVEGRCPEGSRVGTGVATTRVLGRPMEGPIHLVQPSGSGLPELWTDLAGEGVEVEIRSPTSMRDGRLTTTLADLPDIPLSTFRMRFAAGEHALFALRRRPCAAGRPLAVSTPARSEGQNGAYRISAIPLSARGCRRGGAGEGVAARRVVPR